MRFLLFPFVILYAPIIFLRNYFYNKGWLRSFEFDFPIICVGNINTGGTGKTPHVEYLIRNLESKYKLAILSRGYKRKLKGYVLATELSLVEDIGDEPKQYKQKFPAIEVCVSEDRVKGVYNLLQDEQNTQAIIMDDGLQHRRIKPGLQILLTSYNKLFYNDFILPAGNLREFRNAYKRMHIILVTKCPKQLTQNDADSIIGKIKPSENQKIFFTQEIYEDIKPLFQEQKLIIPENIGKCVFISGIANNSSAIAYLKMKYDSVRAMRFPDHHYFTEKEIELIKLAATNTTIITTEKDAMRLMEHKQFILQHGISIFVLPLSVSFLFEQGELFNTLVENYIVKTLTENELLA